MSTRRGGRPSFLRPLTQIAPQSGANEGGGELGPTSKGSIASASFGERPRSKSFPKAGSAAPSSAIGSGGVFASPTTSRASSRHSSFAPHSNPHRRLSSTAAREATSSRRGSMWSSFGEEAAAGGAGGANLTEEEKAFEARKAYVSSIKTIWDSGVNRIAGDLWASVLTGWTSGDIVGQGSQLPHHCGMVRLTSMVNSRNIQVFSLSTRCRYRGRSTLGRLSSSMIWALNSSLSLRRL